MALTKCCSALNIKLGLTTLRWFSAIPALSEKHECKVLIVGGGAGGCTLAAKLSSRLGKGKVIVVEPANKHYYQPMFTLIGGGLRRLDQSYRYMADVLPKNIQWIKDKAIHFDPNNNTVSTSGGHNIKYDMLLIAIGLELKYEKIPGLIEALSIPNGKVCSIYSPKYVERTYNVIRNIEKGNAIFTFPNSPVKCAGAAQKIAYIAEHYFRRMNKRTSINIIYNTALPVIFSAKHYADALWIVCKKRNIQVNTSRNLIKVKPDQDIAIFENLNKKKKKFEEQYSLLHVVPPMGTSPELAKCRDLVNQDGYVAVDPFTLQHLRYKNVFAIGDCSGCPTSKTAAAAGAQSPVVYHNMLAVMNGKPLKHFYDGYTSCPLLTGYNTCILAEFDYKLQPLETFPVAQNIERYSIAIVKKNIMPALYWHVMLNGYWNGPTLARNIFSMFKSGKGKVKELKVKE